MLRMARGDRGFTLIETLASLLVFALVTLGIVPLMLAATRASALSRSFTVGKNVAVEAMERARGLPFYVSRGVQSQDVDFLDLYHPGPANSGDYYEISCVSTSTELACPRGLPDAYGITFRTRFVSIAEDGTPQTVASTGYSAADENLDSPPSRLTQFIVIADWVLGAETRTYQIESLIGDRKFGGAETNGFARINYAVRASTSFDHQTGPAELGVTAGAAESRIETRRNSKASQSATAALLRLFDPEAADEPDLAGSPLQGATFTVEAPPDWDPPATTAADGVLSLTGLGDVAGVNDTTVGGSSPTSTDIEVVANDDELPAAQGGYTFGGSEPLDLWLDKPEAARGADTRLRLHAAERTFSIPAGIQTMVGYTNAITTALPGGSVATAAHVEIAELRLLPTDFAPLGVLQVVDFEADVDCEGAAEGGGAATATWSATVRYWSAETGAYVPVAVSEDSEGVLAQVAANNPLVFEDVSDPLTEVEGSSPGDIYLFPQRHSHVDPDDDDPDDPEAEPVVHNHAGYLQAWRSNQDVTERAEADGRTVSASIVDALSFDSVPLPVASPSYNPSAINVSVGTISCQAVDFR